MSVPLTSEPIWPLTATVWLGASSDAGGAGRKTERGQTKEAATCHALERELLEPTTAGTRLSCQL